MDRSGKELAVVGEKKRDREIVEEGEREHDREMMQGKEPDRSEKLPTTHSRRSFSVAEGKTIVKICEPLL